SRETRLAVWLLHAGHDHDCSELVRGEPESDGRRNPPRIGRQPVPLHGLRQHRRIDPLGRRKDGRQECFPLALATSRPILWKRHCNYWPSTVKTPSCWPADTA